MVQAKSPTFFQLPALNWNEKVKCEDCGKDYRRANAARQSKNCVRGVISCPQLVHTTSKKPAVKKCVSCEKEFPSYYSLQQHRKKDHGLKERKTSDSVADLNKILENKEYSDQLQDVLNACQHFLTETEKDNGQDKVFNFQFQN